MAEIVSLNIKDVDIENYKIAFNLLSSEKQKRILNMRFTDDKKRSIAGNICAIKAISNLTGKEEQDIKISFDKIGRPIYEDVFLSISHSGDFAIAAADYNPIGIDIETIRNNIKPSLIKRICKTDSERNFCTNDENIIRLWSAKEACFKALYPQPFSVSSIELDIYDNLFHFGETIKITSQKANKNYIISTAVCDKI